MNHRVYHTGGSALTLEAAAGLVKGFIPEAQISFDESAAELPFVYLIDNSRLTGELNFEPRDLKDGILHVMNTVRGEAGLSPVG